MQISNVSVTGAPDSAYAAPAPVAALVETAALTLGTPPAPASKLTVHDARNATVIDALGRTLKIKRLSALDKVKLFKATGSTLSENRIVGSYYATAAACVSIDGAPVPFPTTELQLDALVGRLDEAGLESILVALIALATDSDVATEAKNS
jgi:hypothetical protein